jgi:nitroreductase
MTRIPDHPVDPQFLTRWSPRAFAPEAMTEAEVLTVLEAARWAPSASNMQPWRFAYGLRGDAGFVAIAGALAASNRVWAEKAAALIVVASAQTVTKEGVEVPNRTHAFDAGAAWGHLALQAHLSGRVAHAMGGFDQDALRAAIAVPEGFALHCVVALGRHGDPADLPEALRAREVFSQRRPIAELAGRGGFVG